MDYDVVISDLCYSVEEVNKKQRKILNNITHAFQKNSITTIGGPSGSGKTTLLYALAGLLNIEKGQVVVGGQSLYDLKSKERDAFRLQHMSLIYQNLNLFSFMNVEENILLPYTLRNQEVDQEVKSRLAEYLEIMELGPIYKKSIQSLSGGEQQRVAIIRAILSRPQVILADEPTGNLDKENTSKFMDCLQRIKEDKDTTIIIVTHDESVFNCGDHKLRLDNGEIIDGGIRDHLQQSKISS